MNFKSISDCCRSIRQFIRREKPAIAAQAPKPEPVLIYKQPPGVQWRPMWDAGLNAALESRGVGWRNFEAIEIWRETIPGPARIFTSQISDCQALNVEGLYWRPLLHSQRFDRILN
jgi:hypothetical protein